jgi:hypothetical protein
MIPPAKPCRVYIRKRKRAPGRTPGAADLTDLIADLGAETILAASILRQAVDDLKETRAGKVYNVNQHPYYADPLGELRVFFASDWFIALAAGIGQDPADVLRMVQARVN